MQLRNIWTLFLPVVLVALAIACGSGDDSASNTPAASTTPTPTAGTVTATAPLLVSPGRTKPADADHYALRIADPVAFIQQELGTATAIQQPCTFDATNGIIDCSSQGFGKIALDPVPTGADSFNCNALLNPQRALIGANCSSANASQIAIFIYKIAD